MSKKLKIERDIKVVVDVGNGMGGISKRILENLGIETLTLFEEPDGRFPNHLPDPFKEENLRFLQKHIVKEKADLGIAFDGDCDRAGFVDEKGRIVPTDYSMLVYLRHMINEDNKKVVVDIRCPSITVESMKKIGFEVFVTRVGNPYLMEKLHQVDGIFAGEVSGHFWFKKWYGFDDGIFAGMFMVEIASKENSLSTLIDSMPKRFFIPDRRVECPDEKKQKVMEALKLRLKRDYSDAEIIEIDGIKIITDEWSVLVRPSNTQPMITLTVDSKSNNVEEIYARFEKVVKEIISSV